MVAIEMQHATTASAPLLEPVLNVNEIQGNSLGGFNQDYQMLQSVSLAIV